MGFEDGQHKAFARLTGHAKGHREDSTNSLVTLARLGQPRRRLRWAGVVVVSALVGSVATLSLQPLMAASEPGVFASASMLGAGPPNGSIPVSNVSLRVNDGIVDAVKKAKPAVFGVVNYATVADFFTQQTKLRATGVGTGVLFHKDHQFGYFVTNNHVVEGASKVELVVSSGKHIQANVVGTDPYTDLAVLKVPVGEVRGVKPAPFANSDDIQVGEPAVAIGTPMGLDFADTVTAGIVSANHRIMPVEDPQNESTVLDYQAVIQTDAAINPGNSGGPLLNIEGQVIGINSSKIAAQSVEGMGFAIPANEVRSIADQLLQTGHAVHPSLGITGYSLATLPEQLWPDVPIDYGVYVQSVNSDNARRAGLRPQDVIVSISGHTVKTMADLRTYLFQMRPGERVPLRVYRGHNELTLRVKIGKMETANDTRPSVQQQSATIDPFSEVPDTFGG